MAGRIRSKWSWGWIVAWWMICLAAAAMIAAPFIYQLRHAGRIYEGVEVAGVALGGLTLEDATLVLRNRTATFLPSAAITLRYGTRSWTFSPADLGVAVDARATATAAYRVGRSGAARGSPLDGLRQDLADQWQAWRHGYPVAPVLQVDENRLALVLKQIAREVDQAPREGALSITEAGAVAVAGAPGRTVDLEATRAAVLSLLSSRRGGVVSLPVEERLPAVMSAEAAAAKANAVLSHPLTVAIQTGEEVTSRAVGRDALRTWLRLVPRPGPDSALDLDVQVEAGRVRAYVEELAKQFDRPAQDAALDYDVAAKQVVVLKPSRPGRALDVEAATRAISQTLAGLLELAPNAPATVTLSWQPIRPRVDSSDLAALGIKELVTQGTTYFAGSSPERVHNIVTAAQKFVGVVIPPGEEFSFNRYVGDISAANGFIDGLIIWGDRTAVGIGGGVCQVSTTVFRAAVQGGFPITERHAHGYVVSWYGEPGLDATIYTPNVDLRFKNDTSAFLLIKPEVDKAKGRITFSFYGTRPDRTVELSKPEISNVRPPEPPIYQEDSSLPRGTIKQVEWARDGQDVVVRRIVRTGDGKVTEDRFVSKYQPWRSVFLYGPGATLPADAIIGPPLASTPKP